jgi:hypothetical protein
MVAIAVIVPYTLPAIPVPTPKTSAVARVVRGASPASAGRPVGDSDSAEVSVQWVLPERGMRGIAPRG